MLKADRIELAILNLIIDSSESAGVPFALTDLKNAVADKIGPASDAEITDALMLLHQNGVVEIIRYVAGNEGWVQVLYDAEDTAFFWHGDFRCKALPAARRRQQELSGENRNGIFISHIAEEKLIALRLQKLLQDALSPAVPVFVSSDYKSIESGEKWYEAILGALKRSEAVIVLLSKSSLERRWINFEAGFAMGQGARLIPAVWGGLQKSDIGLPLGQLHARDLQDPGELHALVETVATLCHVSLNSGTIPEFLSELKTMEAMIPNSALQVTVFCRESALFVSVRNGGSRPLDMVDAELLVPEQLQGGNAFTSYPPVREKSRYQEDGQRWIGYRLTTQASTRSHLGINPLPTTLMREMGEVTVTGLTIGLPADLTQEQEALVIRYRVSARQASVGPVAKPIAQVERR